MIIKTILSAENHLYNGLKNVKDQKNCFQVYGFDLMIDDLLKVWLIEVNLSPSMSCESPLDQKIKGNLIADTLSMCGIVPIEQRDQIEISKSKQHYSAYSVSQKNKKKSSKPPKKNN